MAFVEWKNEFSVGVVEIDQQHRKLLEIINHLNEAMKLGNDSGRLSRVMDELVGYTRFHFAYEEQLMATVGYAETAEHHRRHEAMVARVEQFRGEVANARATFSLKLMDFLKYWLTKHILETDMGYARHIEAQMPGREAGPSRKAT